MADLFVPPLARLPVAGELVATQDFLANSGGSAANTATALAKLGVRAVVAGKVGNDIFGDFIIRDLQRKNVDISGISRSANYGTSKTVILSVTGEDRRYIHTLGANADLAGSDLAPRLSNRSRVFYLGGYLTLPSLRSSELCALLQLAHAGGARTVLDVVLPSDQTDGQSSLADVLPHVDFFLPNDDEAGRLTGESDTQSQARQLLRYGCDTVVITLGERGAFLMNRRETIETPAFVTQVVDPSGAGDAFAAGVIVGVLENWEMARTLRFANAIGASACMALGCNTGVFTRPQADAFLAQG